MLFHDYFQVITNTVHIGSEGQFREMGLKERGVYKVLSFILSLHSRLAGLKKLQIPDDLLNSV